MRRFLIRAASTTASLAAVAATIAPTAAGAASQGTMFRPLSYNVDGHNWGGYAATGGGYTSVSATWTEATATCNSRFDVYAPWVGLDGDRSSTVEQTGVETDCASGGPVHKAWFEMYPKAPVYLSTSSYPVSAGDVIHASVAYTGGGKFDLTLQNVTRGWTYATTRSLSSATLVSAEVIIESPYGSYPNFGTLSFTDATVNGAPLGDFNPTALDPSANGVFEAQTSALSGGTAFTETYLHR